LDLDSILVWIVGLNSTFGIVLQWRRFGFRYPGWLGVHALVLVTLATGWLAGSGTPGALAAAVWITRVVVPLVLARWLPSLLVARRYRAAERVSKILATLHPMDGWREYPECIRILAGVQQGDLAGARARIGGVRDRDSQLARFATLHLLRAEGRFDEIVAWIESLGDPSRIPLSAELALQYERALGEVGRVEDMLRFHRDLEARLGGATLGPASQLHVAALTGRVALTERLFEGPLRAHPEEVRRFWRAVALQAAGEEASSRQLLEKLAGSGPPDVRAAARRRLENPPPPVLPSELSPPARSLLRELEHDIETDLRYRTLGTGKARRRVVTFSLIGANVVAFLLEIPGGTEDLDNLVRLGALVAPPELLGSSAAWRVVTAGFLHFGLAHVALNCLGILVLGSYVERVWGRWRLLVCYFVAMVGANALGLRVIEAEPTAPVVMLGASGGVMGVLGAGLAFAVLAWRRLRAAVLQRQIVMFLVVLALQAGFDATTPEVSQTLHLLGLGLGFVTAMGLGFFDRRPGSDASAGMESPASSAGTTGTTGTAGADRAVPRP